MTILLASNINLSFYKKFIKKFYAKRKKQKIKPAQIQEKSRIEEKMNPPPQSEPKIYENGRLSGKTVLITGAGSGIGKEVSLLFAKEGASLVIAYLNEDNDTFLTRYLITASGGFCKLIKTAISKGRGM